MTDNEVQRKKVFISWSGPVSKAAANAALPLLSDMFDGLVFFVSNASISAGDRSLNVVHEELNDAVAGILMVTAENQRNPWLNFEAGALARQVSDSKRYVIPLFLQADSLADLKLPIGDFHAVLLDEEGVTKMFESLGLVSGLGAGRGQSKFNNFGPAFISKVERALEAQHVTSAATTPEEPRTTDDKVDELLLSVRELLSRQFSGVTGSLRKRSSREMEIENLAGVARVRRSLDDVYNEAQEILTDRGIPVRAIAFDEDTNRIRVLLNDETDENLRLVAAIMKTLTGYSVDFIPATAE